MYLGLHLMTLPVFSCGVKETFDISWCYTAWKGTYRRFGTTYPSDFQRSTNYQSSLRTHPQNS